MRSEWVVEVEGEVFVPTEVDQRRYQGMTITNVEGKKVVRAVTLPAGTLIVRARQRLARVAAQLLEARSEDSLLTWNFFDGLVKVPDSTDEDGKLPYPVVRLRQIGDWSTARVVR